MQREFDAAVADAAAQARAEGDAKIEELRKELESTEAARDKALEQEEVAKKHIKIYNPKRIDIRQWKREQEALEERMRELEGTAGEARAKLEDARQTERRVRSEVEREFWKNLEQAKEQVRREYEADVARAKAEVEASLSSRLASAKEDGRRQADDARWPMVSPSYVVMLALTQHHLHGSTAPPAPPGVEARWTGGGWC